MATPADFYKKTWAYPKKEKRVFNGAIQEYSLSNGGVIALAFLATGVYYLEDNMGYYDKVDYTAKDGVFNKPVAIPRYSNCKTVGNIFISETGDKVDEVVIYDEVFNKIPFADAEAAKKDILDRMYAVGIFGFFTVHSGI